MSPLDSSDEAAREASSPLSPVASQTPKTSYRAVRLADTPDISRQGRLLMENHPAL